jgi:hypothetical protein
VTRIFLFTITYAIIVAPSTPLTVILAELSVQPVTQITSTKQPQYEGWYKSNALNFIPRKCNCSNNEIYVDDSQIFGNYETIFPQSWSFSSTFANIMILSLLLQAGSFRARLLSQFHQLFKCLTQRFTELTSTVCSPCILLRCLYVSMAPTSLAVKNWFITPLHMCIYICHYKLLVHCAHVTDPSTTRSWETRNFNCSTSDGHSFLYHSIWREKNCTYCFHTAPHRIN